MHAERAFLRPDTDRAVLPSWDSKQAAGEPCAVQRAGRVQSNFFATIQRYLKGITVKQPLGNALELECIALKGGSLQSF